jgi:hypothetical protein
MSSSDPGAFSGRPTRDLEQLLRDPGTPADQRQLISDELGRRFEAELTGETGGAPPPPQPPPREESPRSGSPPGQGPTSPPFGAPGSAPPPDGESPGEWDSPGPPPVVPPPAPRRSRRTGLKIVLALLAVLVVGGGYFAWQGTQQEEDEPINGSTCVTDVVDCPLEVSVPVGTSCTCIDEFGTVYEGFVG